MPKRSQARRKAYQRQNHEDRSFRDKKTRTGRRQDTNSAVVVDLNARTHNLYTAYAAPRVPVPLEARTPSQKRYISAIREHNLTFGIGPAGTGKSYCAGALAAQALEGGHVDRIILTRPAVEAGEQLGFLPGDINEKFSPYIDAFRDILNERLGAGTVDYCLRHGRIVASPLAYMRGKTFDSRTFVVLDEAQNTTPAQMKMFLTRIGEDSKVVVNGDIRQSDIRGANGLADAVMRLGGLSGVYVHRFERADIVRSGLVREIIDRYEPED
ncbi:MAG: PhoH family protein [Gammaproteobacteria bacterium]|nr:PhoH family protein [Gammaproteobacteria bacterium]MBK6581889.1 PhoH family protein [Gammaproteobacteria bacterium]MBK7520724.1 PhoH family protein [Gammaproteobacteria bacterium]MBK7728363.1 PhoH family protein [Gammaproteobacteria bacterium]MBK8308292.1 PhoH family protein [Gammaproteobacteria bacterium]